MLILSSGPLRTGSSLWHTRGGSHVLTVICKITYWLQPGEAVVAAEQEAVNDTDDHWDDDPNRSVRAPSDLMPNKIRPEVTLVGYAYAPNNQPVRSLVARMIVGDVDKSIEVHCDRTFFPDGSLHEGTRFTRMRLNWERAGGGPGTNNPVGIRADARDSYGRRQVPNLQPIGTYISSPDEFVAPVGFGPIASTWPSRADLVNRAPPTVGEGLEGPTAAYYNAAPADQQLAMLRENERIVLENLHPEHSRLVTNLPGCRPAIFVERTQGKAARITAQADSLWIDTDRGIATLTWRARVPLVRQDEQGRVLVALEPPGRELTWNDVLQVITNGREIDDLDEDDPIDTITSTTSLVPAGAVLPFAARSETPNPASREVMRSSPNAALPFQTARAPSAPPQSNAQWPTPSNPPTSNQPKPPPVPAPTASSPSRISLPGTVVGHGLGVPPPPTSNAATPPPPPPVRPSVVSFAELSPSSVEKTRPPASPWASGSAPAPLTQLNQPQTIGSQAVAAAAAQAEAPKEPVRESPPFSKSVDAPATNSAPAPAPAQATRSAGTFDAAFGGAKARTNGSNTPTVKGGFDGAFGGIKAASDAAAAKSEATEAATNDRTLRREVVSDSAPTARRQAVLTLLHFDAQILPRVRRSKRFTAALASKSRSRRSPGLDESMKDAPSDDRQDILRVLSCGQPVDAAEIHKALTDCLDELDELEPPLLLVAGELRPVFDEVEVLRTTIAVAQQVAGGDKKIMAAIAVGQEALAAPIAPRPETTLGFVKQIEQAAGSLSLPARYVPSEVERVLAEGRKYKRRTLLGAPRVRADLVLVRSGELMPIYLPDAASTSLPLLLAFPIIALCDVIPREDLTETHDEALLAMALGRVLRNRGN